MINEGIIANSTKILVKSEMVRQLEALGPTTPSLWKQAVFRALTDHEWEDVDWDFEDNKAGAFLWILAFDELVEELLEDGFARVVQVEGSEERVLVPLKTDPGFEPSYLVYRAGP